MAIESITLFMLLSPVLLSLIVFVLALGQVPVHYSALATLHEQKAAVSQAYDEYDERSAKLFYSPSIMNRFYEQYIQTGKEIFIVPTMVAVMCGTVAMMTANSTAATSLYGVGVALTLARISASHTIAVGLHGLACFYGIEGDPWETMRLNITIVQEVSAAHDRRLILDALATLAHFVAFGMAINEVIGGLT